LTNHITKAANAISQRCAKEEQIERRSAMGQKMKELVTLQGFTRIKIGEERNGKTIIVGDSGWRGPNPLQIKFT